MYNRAGEQIINGKRYRWSNWFIDSLYLDQPLCKIEGYTVPDEWLNEMFDDTKSAYLMPMPMENYN